MRQTIDENPQYFGAFNNGITIVCRDIELSEKGEVTKLVSPSIVNGGQTTVVMLKLTWKDLICHRLKFL